MHREHIDDLLTGQLLEEEVELTLSALCRLCDISAEQAQELVDYGVIEPLGPEPRQWRFSGIGLRRAHCALRLERDLGVNPAGAALVLDLLEELQDLRRQLARLGM